jgi:hypothetical protein
MVLNPYEGFFELHSWATEQKKDKIGVQNGDFLANSEKFKSLHCSVLKNTTIDFNNRSNK